MDNLKKDQEIARKLPRAWPVFFDLHGRLLDIQRKAIPVILEGKNVLISSPTASGKTEAVCAPLVERNIDIISPWTILYISPTRALVNDLYERLYTPLLRMNLRLIRRTGDHPAKLDKIPHVLITTPESFDSIMCRGRLKDSKYGHILARVSAVVLDEIHLLYGTPRGEQVKWLIERLKRLKNHARESGWSFSNNIQIVGLSATIAEPVKVILDFMDKGENISSEGKREMMVLNDLIEPVQTVLPEYIKSLTISEKILVFCNARKRVDSLASELRKQLGKYGYEVVAHHGSLSQKVREEAEDAIKHKERIVAFATSTLELGIDIGDIDLVVLDGPAPDVPALLQRLGRGNRRTGQMRLIACAENLSDALIHDAMIDAVKNDCMTSPEAGQNYSVLFQQIASYIFQSPQRSRKRAFVEDFLQTKVLPELAKSIIDSMLEAEDLLQEGPSIRLGNYWQDMTTYGKIHSNIDSSGGYSIIDEHSGDKIASGIKYVQGKGLKTGGEFLQIKNFRDYNIEVKKVKDETLASGEWSYATKRGFKNSSQASAIRQYLKIDDKIWPLVKKSDLLYVFHLGGTVRQTLIEGLARISGDEECIACSNQFYFALPGGNNEKPYWLDDFQMAGFEIYLNNHIDWFERKLCRPGLNSRLPINIRCEEVKSWLNLDVELSFIRESLWEQNFDKTVIDACLILSGIKI